uniref:Uncharacterized protein n=1 Tax=Setaria italica TaxID=4555 RepID=K3Y0K6_SETIT
MQYYTEASSSLSAGHTKSTKGEKGWTHNCCANHTEMIRMDEFVPISSVQIKLNQCITWKILILTQMSHQYDPML